MPKNWLCALKISRRGGEKTSEWQMAPSRRSVRSSCNRQIGFDPCELLQWIAKRAASDSARSLMVSIPVIEWKTLECVLGLLWQHHARALVWSCWSWARSGVDPGGSFVRRSGSAYSQSERIYARKMARRVAEFQLRPRACTNMRTPVAFLVLSATNCCQSMPQGVVGRPRYL